jgi:signal transduction histidine kinase
MSLEVLIVRRWPERRPVVLGTSLAGFAAVFAAAYAADDAALAIGILYVLPVMLLALELGLRGGLVAAAAAIGVVVVGELLGRLDVGSLGILTRGVAFVAAGTLAGRFSDRMRDAHRREQRLLDSSLALSDPRSLSGLVAVAAEAALGAPKAVGAIVELDGEVAAVRGSAHGRRTDTPILARGARIGRFGVFHDAELSPEDRAGLDLLARQVGLAADNQRLLDHEREAAALGTQLRATRAELDEHRSELGQLLDAQEGERRHVADTLHEDLAQALAAVLLGLRILRRDTDSDALDDVHGQVVGVLDDLRSLATSLRPSTLAQLGLGPALEGLAEQTGRLSLEFDVVPSMLPEPLPTGAYRLVQEALAASRPDSAVNLHVRSNDGELVLDLDLELEDETRLAAANAWVAVLNGSLSVESSGARKRMYARLPLPAAAAATPHEVA